MCTLKDPSPSILLCLALRITLVLFQISALATEAINPLSSLRCRPKGRPEQLLASRKKNQGCLFTPVSGQAYPSPFSRRPHSLIHSQWCDFGVNAMTFQTFFSNALGAVHWISPHGCLALAGLLRCFVVKENYAHDSWRLGTSGDHITVYDGYWGYIGNAL